jgi:hypothetical protein
MTDTNRQRKASLVLRVFGGEASAAVAVDAGVPASELDEWCRNWRPILMASGRMQTVGVTCAHCGKVWSNTAEFAPIGLTLKLFWHKTAACPCHRKVGPLALLVCVAVLFKAIAEPLRISVVAKDVWLAGGIVVAFLHAASGAWITRTAGRVLQASLGRDPRKGEPISIKTWMALPTQDLDRALRALQRNPFEWDTYQEQRLVYRTDDSRSAAEATDRSSVR